MNRRYTKCLSGPARLTALSKLDKHGFITGGLDEFEAQLESVYTISRHKKND